MMVIMTTVMITGYELHYIDEEGKEAEGGCRMRDGSLNLMTDDDDVDDMHLSSELYGYGYGLVYLQARLSLLFFS